MAKKKGRRSANVARKREKRKRDQKSRQKQLALEKQRRLRYEKSEEEHLHACISESRKLLLEPEFEGVLFDPELMYMRVMDLLNDYGADSPISPTDVLDEAASEEQPASTPEAEQACESFRLEVLPHLVTPEFMQQFGQALTACETRLKLIGNQKLAEVAFVTRSLFDAAPSEILAFHPMIQAIGIETLRVLVEEQDLIIEWRNGVKEILSDVLEHEDLETDASEELPVFSDASVDGKRPKHEDTQSAILYSNTTEVETETYVAPALPDLKGTAVTEPVRIINPESTTTAEIPAQAVAPQLPSLSPDELPAQALYKNFNGLGIKERFEKQTDAATSQNGLLNYVLVSESEEQVEFVDVENERYVKVTEERLQLHARSGAELSIAMAEVEAQCTSALMYLAKTIEERGGNYATE